MTFGQIGDGCARNLNPTFKKLGWGYPVVPPKMEYSLTGQAKLFYQPILAMAKLVKANAVLLEKVKRRNEHDATTSVKRSG